MSATDSHAIGPPVCVFSGADEYLKQQAIDGILARVCGGAQHPPACSLFDPSADLADVLDELRTLPMLAAHRVVIMRDADAFITRARAGLERYCEDASPTATLILVCKSFLATTRLHKAVSRIGVVGKCDPPKGVALASWITQQASEVHGKRLDRSGAMLLRDLVGDDLQALDAELGKLATYVGEARTIAIADIEQLVGLRRQEKVFGIVDALALGNARRALDLWDAVWATDRAAPGRAIGGLAFVWRRYLNAKYHVERGGNCFALAKQFFTSASELEDRLRRLSTDRLERGLCDLLDADVCVKSGRGDVRSVIETFIIRHGGAAVPRAAAAR